MSKNAEGWIRHRGGKCPVEIGDIIDVRLRRGEVISGVAMEGSGWHWDHRVNSFDITAYRLHKPAEQVAPEIKVTHIDHEAGVIHAESVSSSCGPVKAEWSEIQDSGPLQWRDRIAEIDVEVQARTAERADLVQKLASEGFALIGRVVEPAEDMSDWRNWKVGDLVERVKDGEESGMQLNTPMNITSFDWDDKRGQSVEVDSSYFPFVSSLKWHSRPSA